MGDELTYTPAELCDMLDISKSTLLRWEHEGLLPAPRRDRSNRRQQRLYGAEHLRIIGEIQGRALRREYTHVGLDATWDSIGAEEVQEAAALLKFLQGGDVGRTALKELRRHDHLRPKTIRTLLRIADRYVPGDGQWCAIVTVASEQGCKLLERQQRPADMSDRSSLTHSRP